MKTAEPHAAFQAETGIPAIVLIPYLDRDPEANEVYIVVLHDPPTDRRAFALSALAEFAHCTPDDLDAIAGECDAWNATRILLPDPQAPSQWCAWSIPAFLDGRWEEPQSPGAEQWYTVEMSAHAVVKTSLRVHAPSPMQAEAFAHDRDGDATWQYHGLVDGSIEVTAVRPE